MAKWLKWTINTLIFLVFLISLGLSIESGNWWILIGCLLVFVAYMIFKSWSNLMMGMRNIETAVWGKPLDRDMWDKGEMNNTKVKFVYRGKPMKKVPLENKHLATFFFWLFIAFFGFFVYNRYTLNIIFAMIMLQFSLAFKTWAIIREMKE